MTNEQAYRRGVDDVLAIVTAAGDTLRRSSGLLRLRRELAIETLRAVAEESRALMLPQSEEIDEPSAMSNGSGQ